MTSHLPTVCICADTAAFLLRNQILLFWKSVQSTKRKYWLRFRPFVSLSIYFRCDFSYDVWERSEIRILTNKFWNQKPFDMMSTAMRHTVINTLFMSRIQDPMPSHPGIRDGQKILIRDPDPGLTTRIIFPRAWKQFFGLKYFNSLMGWEKIRIRDPGWKKLEYRIRDKHPGSVNTG
jgi:hypothetical protein